MNKLSKVLCAVATATLMVAPAAAQTGDERASGASVSPGTGTTAKNKKRCRTEEYVDSDGVTRTRNRCVGGFLLGGLGALGGGGAVVGTGLAIGAIAMAASSSSSESP